MGAMIGEKVYELADGVVRCAMCVWSTLMDRSGLALASSAMRRCTLHALATLALLGCQQSQVLCVFDDSGSQMPLGSPALCGARLASETPLASAQTGESVPSVGLDIRDSRSDPAEAAKVCSSGRSATIALGFTDSDIALAGVRAFFGAEGTSNAAATLPPFLIVGATDPALAQESGAPSRTFYACFTDDVQASAAASFFSQRWGKRCVVVLDSKYDYTRTLARAFTAAFGGAGGTVVAAIDMRSSDALQQIGQLASRRGEVDGIFLALEPDLATSAIPAVRQALPEVRCIGGDGLDFEGIDTLLGGRTDGVAFCTHAWFGEGASEQARDFAVRYRARFGREPSSFSALGYDAVMIARLAVARSADAKGSVGAVRALGAIRNYQGVSGTISYESGGIPTKPVWIVELKRGNRTLAEKIDPKR